MRSEITGKFVRHFGDAGRHWGINRTAGQILALLYMSGQALCADEMCQELHVSRSNVSMSVKELESWGLIRLHRKPGDRRDYAAAPADIGQIMRIIAQERRRRELDPTREILRGLLGQSPSCEEDRHAQDRLRDMSLLIENFACCAEK